MCGIFGIVHFERDTPIRQADLERCLREISHRGPDGCGIHIDGLIGFSHRRLAIIDVDERAAQPFLDQDTGIVLTYNGEIFNYRELRKELTSLGHRFITMSDTEVLCKAFDEWGVECLRRLRGMFAFALHDRRTQTTYIARDRMGVKPLYFAPVAGGIAFASQPSAILIWPGVVKKIRPEGLSSFLSFRAVYGSLSLFEGISKVQPGTYLRIHRSTAECFRWWKLPLGSEESSPGSLDEIIGTSVEEHTVSDVPVAALLSGGLDSSIITAEIESRTNLAPICFTGAVEGEGYDETLFAAAVANQFSLRHHVVPIPTPDNVAAASELISRRCHPLGMHNELAMYALAREISANHKVALTGEGADELFAGYSRLYRTDFDYWRLRLTSGLPSRLRQIVRSHLQLPQGESTEFDFFMQRYCYFPIEAQQQLFRPQFRPAPAVDDASFRELRQEFEAGNETFFQRIYRFMLSHHLPALLEMVDNTTMAAGVEARVPFVDERVIARAVSLKKSDIIRWNSLVHQLRALVTPVARFSERSDTSKAALRDLYRNRLPAAVLQRPKLGFALPLGRWAVSEPSEGFRKQLLTGSPASAQFFDIDAVRRWYSEGARRPTDTFGRQVWLMCNLELFLQQHV